MAVTTTYIPADEEYHPPRKANGNALSKGYESMKAKLSRGHSKKASLSGSTSTSTFCKKRPPPDMDKRQKEVAPCSQSGRADIALSDDGASKSDDLAVTKKSRADWDFENGDELLLEAVNSAARKTANRSTKIRWSNVLEAWKSFSEVPDFAKEFSTTQLKSRYHEVIGLQLPSSSSSR